MQRLLAGEKRQMGVWRSQGGAAVQGVSLPLLDHVAGCGRKESSADLTDSRRWGLTPGPVGGVKLNLRESAESADNTKVCDHRAKGWG